MRASVQAVTAGRPLFSAILLGIILVLLRPLPGPAFLAQGSEPQSEWGEEGG